MSDTPRTDRAINNAHPDDDTYDVLCAVTSISRHLELELTAAKQEIEKLKLKLRNIMNCECCVDEQITCDRALKVEVERLKKQVLAMRNCGNCAAEICGHEYGDRATYDKCWKEDEI